MVGTQTRAFQPVPQTTQGVSKDPNCDRHTKANNLINRTNSKIKGVRQWLMTSHVRRYHRHYKTSGHVWQGRFKAFPVQSDEHYLTVLRYVERNPLRANLVDRSQHWEWSSLKPTVRSGPQGLLCNGPVVKPSQWTRHVNGVQTEAELKSLQHSIDRGTPFGDARWQTTTAKKLGLESSLRPRGRPRKPIK